MNQTHKGFTLLEVLVVLVIISILTSISYLIAIPTIERNHNLRVCQAIDQYLRHTQQQAWQQQQLLAISYQHHLLQTQRYHQQHWQAQPHHPLTIPKNLQLTLDASSQSEGIASIVFAPNHITTPFTLTLKQQQPLCQWHSDHGKIVFARSRP